MTVGTESRAATRSAGFSHIPPSVGEILFSRGLSQLQRGPSSGRDAAAAAKVGTQPNDAAASLSNNDAEAGDAADRDWLDWVRIGLPIELAPHVVQVLLKVGNVAGAERQLIVFADSPAWCARLRYALLALEERIRARDPAIRRLNARVLRLD